MFSISGIASGLDTDAMLRQLMQLERQPITALESRQAALRRVDDAWGDVTKRLSSLRSAIDGLTKGTSLADRWKASSSHETVATATVSGRPTAGTTSFRVDQLATAQSTHSTAALSGGDVLVGAGTIRITRDGDGTVLAEVATDATTTLADLAKSLDAATGVRASVVKKGDGDHRLVLSSEQTGQANTFSVAFDPAGSALEGSLGGFAAPTGGVDALITLGGLQVSRSSNTVTDLVTGVTIGLKAVGDATVTVAQDADSAIGSVRKLVNEINSTLARLKELTAYDPETRKAGPLAGDGTARRLGNQLRRGIIDQVGDLATGRTASSVGITLERDGSFKVDDVKLKAALEADPTAVDGLFNRSGTSSLAGVSFTSATRDTQVGDHAVVVSQVARVARLTGATYTSPAGNPETFTITAADGTQVDVTIENPDDASTAVAKINAALTAANVRGLSAKVVTLPDNTAAIELEESRYGSAYGFTVGANNLGLAAGRYDGRDVAGTINGETATGTGRRLTLPSTTTDPAKGLVLSVTLPEDATVPASSTVTVSQGVAGRLDGILAAFEGGDGAVKRAQDGLSSRIKMFQDRIDAFEVRLSQRERTLIRQFTAMETALSSMQSQGNWLAGQLTGLMANSQQR